MCTNTINTLCRDCNFIFRERIFYYTNYYLLGSSVRMNSSAEKRKPFSSLKGIFGKLKKNKNSLESDLPVEPKKQKKQGKKKKWIILAVIVLVIAAVIFGLKHFKPSSSTTGMAETFTSASVVKGDISSTLNGTGTLKPANSYDVTSLASGKVLSADFEEGDIVQEGSTLYQIDTTDADTAIKSAELNLERSRQSYKSVLETKSNLNVTTPASGTITALSVQLGDTVADGATIGTIRDSATMTLSVPFNSGDVASFYVGESAEVTLDGTFEALTGKISKISGTEEILTGNMLVKYVTIDVSNPGCVSETTAGTAKVGAVACNSSATFKYKSSQSIIAKASGTVAAIKHDEGSTVTKGDVVVVLSSDDIDGNIINAELSLEDAQNSLDDKKKELENYKITSPISGTVTSKKCKAGDKLGSGSTTSSSTLCTILDLSYLTVEMSVDELDIKKVSVGQEVTVTVDAAGEQTYTGVVTKVNISGTTTNGVTAYPVTVRIDDTDGLLPGMNVSTSIVVDSVSDVLTVPLNAVVRGNQVLVKKSASGTDETPGGVLAVGASGIPDGFEYVDVTLGINNSELIEIKSGLSEGDIIAVSSITADANMMGSASGSDVTYTESSSSTTVQAEGGVG
jgi:HlyD family secretion protein